VDADPALLCSPAQKAELEAANGVTQIDYLTSLVIERGQRDLRESHIKELQRIAIDGIYPCGGTYRDARDHISITGSEHTPPEAAFVESYVREMVDELNRSRDNGTAALDRAAYALWRLNWIHPFRGGNGRTSRAIAYLILCMDLEIMMPGTPSLPNLIRASKEAYVDALKAADASLRNGASLPDLSIMTAYLKDLVVRQMASAIDALAKTRN
jgi:Fic family protein